MSVSFEGNKKETQPELSRALIFLSDLKIAVGIVAISLVFMVLVSTDVKSDQSGKKQLILDCVRVTLDTVQQKSANYVETTGEVTCPSADLVGFPPRERKHNRNGTISLQMENDRVVCPGSIPELGIVSDNGGGHGKFDLTNDLSSVSVPIHCFGATPVPLRSAPAKTAA